VIGRERFVEAIGFRETDGPPHFEHMFELTVEAFGRAFPGEKAIAAATTDERERLLNECIDIYALIVERFNWDALAVWRPWGGPQQLECLRLAKAALGDRIMVGGFVGESIHAIETTRDFMQFATDLYERPEAVHAQAQTMCDSAIARGRAMRDAGADFVSVVSDVAFNQGPFIAPAMFHEFCAPYMQRIAAALKGEGLYVIQHSDGNLMSILDDFLAAEPHVLHSIDPMAGMDMAEVKRLTYGKVALMGNVQCNYLQDGPESLIRESARYALRHGAPGGGFIFSSSNTIFEGLPLRHYEVMLEELASFAATHPAL
jgi:uroporphyrinogen decarboxylase